MIKKWPLPRKVINAPGVLRMVGLRVGWMNADDHSVGVLKGQQFPELVVSRWLWGDVWWRMGWSFSDG